MKMYKEALSYDDVLLVPQYSDIKSRREVSLQSQLGHYILELPIIASPMDTIVEAEMAAAMADFEQESHSSSEEDLENGPVL